jgi:hypothetical protein
MSIGNTMGIGNMHQLYAECESEAYPRFLHNLERRAGWQLTKSRSIQRPLQIVCLILLFIPCMAPGCFAYHLPHPLALEALVYVTLILDSPWVSKALISLEHVVLLSLPCILCRGIAAWTLQLNTKQTTLSLSLSAMYPVQMHCCLGDADQHEADHPLSFSLSAT